MNDYHEDTLQELVKIKQRIVKEITMLENRLRFSPEGTLRVTRNHKGNQFYRIVELNDTKGIYLSKKNGDLISRLAQKDYEKKLLPVLKKQHKVIEKFLKDYEPQAAIDVFDQLKGPENNSLPPYTQVTKSTSGSG